MGLGFGQAQMPGVEVGALGSCEQSAIAEPEPGPVLA